MSLIKKNQTIEIKVYYVEVENNGFSKHIFLTDEEVSEYQKDEKLSVKLQCVVTKWKLLNWGSHQQILNQSMVEDENGMTRTVDYYRFSDLTIKNTLIGWDLLDEDSKPVPLTHENIDALPADFVGKLSERYNTLTNVSQEDKKKYLK